MPSKKHQSPIESNNAFMVKIEDLVREIVIQNSIPYYRIESRMEHHSQLGGEDIYLPVIRIITYFEDTVSQISEIMRDEFDIAIEKSIDKKKIRVDSFSYKHVQYIAGLKNNRRELTEYRRSGDKKFEIQVCSMLQDAWTGIEKELGYDNASFPEETKRDFYRVGALLEMADIEFCKIRSLIGSDHSAGAPASKPDLVIVDEAKDIAVATYSNTFAEHLPESQEVLDEDIAADFEGSIEEETVVEDTVIEETSAPAPQQPVAVQQPEAQPQAITPQPAPVVEEKAPKTNVFAAIVSSLVPRRAVPAKTPSGLAPQRVKAPVLTEADLKTSALNLFGMKSQTMNANIPEAKKTIEEKIAPVVNVIAPQPKAEPVAKQEPPVQKAAPVQAPPAPVIPVVELPQPLPVQEMPVPAPKQEPLPEPKHEEPVAKSNDSNPNLTVNANGIVERATEITREPEQVVERVVPFFEEVVPKASRTALLDENAPMTDASLREYVMTSKLLKEVDQKIAERAGAKINPEIDIEGDVERLRFLKVFTLKQLHDRITDNKNDIVSFAEKWIGKDNGGSFDSGISLFYLEYLLVGKKNDPAFAIEYVVKFISDNDYSARYIIPTYNSIRNTEVSNFSHLTLKV